MRRQKRSKTRIVVAKTANYFYFQDSYLPIRVKRHQKSDNDSAEFAQRVDFIAEKVGGLSRLAEEADVSRSNLSRYSSGDGLPTLATAIAIARAGNVTLDWLGTGRGSPESISIPDAGIPFFDQQASAGPGLLALSDHPPAETICVPIAQIRRQTGVDSSSLCALLAEGDSMYPTIKSGALLVLDRTSVQPREGVFVVLRGEEVLVKRIQPRGPRVIRLISDNSQYPQEDVSLDDISLPVRLFGRVIWIAGSI